MSAEIRHRLGEGILRVVVIDTPTGPVFAVQLISAAGPIGFASVLPALERAVLVAVRRKHRSIKRRKRWNGDRVIRRTTVETDVELATGLTVTYPSETIRDGALTILPEEPNEGTWLDADALRRVEGRLVRLELHRPPLTRGTYALRPESA